MTTTTIIPTLITEMFFNYATIKVEPYKGSDASSEQLLKGMINKLNDSTFPNSKRVINRFAGRTGLGKRDLVLISSPFAKGGVRTFGKIALIKNKAPLLLHGTSVIEEIDKPENRQFIEVTNYVIDFTGMEPVVMIEYNHEGPRLSDLEYYFRQILKDFRIGKAIKTVLHLNIAISDLSSKMDNVFSIDVKVKAHELAKSTGTQWYKTFTQLKEDSAFVDAKIEIGYQKKKEKTTNKYIKNLQGLKIARGIVDWVNRDISNIEKVQDLKMSYQLEGSEEIYVLDFIKNKATSVLNIPVNNKGVHRASDLKDMMGFEFNDYIRTGKTNMNSNN